MADADIRLKRGRATTLDITYKPAIADGTTPYSKPFASGYTGSLVLRRKVGSSFNGPKIDTLTSANNRINLLISSATSTDPNIQLLWSSAQAAALPNESFTVYGDLKITKTSGSSVEHSFRISFEIVPEITD